MDRRSRIYLIHTMHFTYTFARNEHGHGDGHVNPMLATTKTTKDVTIASK
jgi:hypothetical protein